MKMKKYLTIAYPVWENSENIGDFNERHRWMACLMDKEIYESEKNNYKYTKVLKEHESFVEGQKWNALHIQYNEKTRSFSW